MVSRITALMIFVLLAGSCGSSPTGPGVPGPGLVSPADGSTVTGPQVTFAWDAVSGATKYYHQISSDASMQSPSETVVTSPSATVSPGSPGTWWWRVRASVSGQSSYTPWSEVWSFSLN